MRIRTFKISKLNTESFDKLLVDIVNDNFGYVLQCVENVADSKGCTRIDLKIVFDIPHDSITYDYVHHLFNEYKQIGMDSWWRFSYRKIFDEKFAIHSYPITEKNVEDNISRLYIQEMVIIIYHGKQFQNTEQDFLSV